MSSDRNCARLGITSGGRNTQTRTLSISDIRHNKICSICQQIFKGYCFVCLECSTKKYFCENCADGHNLVHVLSRVCFPEHLKRVNKFISAIKSVSRKKTTSSADGNGAETSAHIVCEVCNKRFSERKKFNDHKRVHQNTSFSCNHCNKIYKQNFNLLQHIKKKHSTRAAESTTHQSRNQVVGTSGALQSVISHVSENTSTRSGNVSGNESDASTMSCEHVLDNHPEIPLERADTSSQQIAVSVSKNTSKCRPALLSHSRLINKHSNNVTPRPSSNSQRCRLNHLASTSAVARNLSAASRQIVGGHVSKELKDKDTTTAHSSSKAPMSRRKAEPMSCQPSGATSQNPGADKVPRLEKQNSVPEIIIVSDSENDISRTMPRQEVNQKNVNDIEEGRRLSLDSDSSNTTLLLPKIN